MEKQFASPRSQTFFGVQPRNWDSQVSEAETLLERLPQVEIDPLSVEAPASHAYLSLAQAEVAPIHAIAARLGFSVEEVFVAVFAVLLSRLTGEETPRIVEASSQPALHTYPVGEATSFADLTKRRTMSFLEEDEPDRSRCAAFRLGRQLQNIEPKPPSALCLTIEASAEGVEAELAGDGARWPSETLQRWIESLRSLVLAAAAAPGQRVSSLPLWSEAACRAFYVRYNRTAVEFPQAAPAHRMFARWAVQTPGATAVICGSKQYTYREMDERSTILARMLMRLGVGPGGRVAICMERSADLPLALLAVLKSGACYIPLDPGDPPQRREAILKESRPAAVISSSTTHCAGLQRFPLVLADQLTPGTEPEAALPEVEPESVAYIIYTSGTTGRPKGALIPHRGLTNSLCSMQETVRLAPGEKALAVATIAFDMATMDLLQPLSAGGCVVVAGPGAGGDPQALSHLIERYDTRLLSLTPVSWRMLIEAGWPGKSNLKMISGGEALPRDLADQLLAQGAELWNGYGPTETAICCSLLRVRAGEDAVLLGPPMANVSFYVADEEGRLLPEGVAGELWIGGRGVGLGYLERPELTRERFVPDPFEASKWVYRTGDLVRLVEGGSLQFLGRNDFQVKLHGRRIELGEIESVLRGYSGVADAVVVLAQKSGEPFLAAYVSSNGESEPAVAGLREYAAALLPEYMLPRSIVCLRQMPLTPSDKIDRRRLSELAPVEMQQSARAAPSNELEDQLLAIFRGVLGEGAMGVTDSFFDHGGYSLLIVRLFLRIQRELKVNLPISVIFEAPTVRALAQYIERGSAPPVVVPIRAGGSSTPLFVVQSYLIYDALSKVADPDRPLYGVREVAGEDPNLSLDARAEIFARAIVERYPDSPVTVVGWCAAAPLAIEVARRLDRLYGSEGLVVLIDADRPGYLKQATASVALPSRLRASWRFHHNRVRRLGPRAKAEYIAARLSDNWYTGAERFVSRHQKAALWLNRWFPLLIPDYLVAGGAAVPAADSYQLRPYRGSVVLLRANEAPELPDVDTTLGWKDVATGKLEVIFVEGTHLSMFREPHLRDFGRQLNRMVRQAGLAGDAQVA